jgi:hypothetical protein
LIERCEAGPSEKAPGANKRQHPAHAGEETRITLVFQPGFVALIHTPELLVEG